MARFENIDLKTSDKYINNKDNKQELWKAHKVVYIGLNLIAVPSIISSKRYKNIFAIMGAYNQTQALQIQTIRYWLTLNAYHWSQFQLNEKT